MARGGRGGAGGRRPSRVGCIRRRHRVGAKISVDGASVDRVVKPTGDGIHCSGGGSICERQRCTGRLRLDAEGNLYVLDSEDEDCDMEVAADYVGVATEGATNENRAGSYDPPMEGHPMVDTDANEAAVKDLPSEGHPLVIGDGAAANNLDPKVADRLKKVLANIDPVDHDVVVSMYKLLVPTLFRP